jgi:hypothetical protein
MRSKTGTRQHTITYTAHARAESSAAHRTCFRTEEVTGSNPVPPTAKFLAGIAVGAHLLVQQRVGVGLADWAGCLAVCWVPSGVRGCRCIRALERSK